MRKARCLYPPCAKNAHCRGLCATHYVAALNAVNDGKTSWARLESTGRAGCPRHSGSEVPKFEAWLAPASSEVTRSWGEIEPSEIVDAIRGLLQFIRSVDEDRFAWWKHESCADPCAIRTAHALATELEAST